MLWFYLQTISENHTWRKRAQAHSSHGLKPISKLTLATLRLAQILPPHGPKPISKFTFKPFKKKKKKEKEKKELNQEQEERVELARLRTQSQIAPQPQIAPLHPTSAPARSHWSRRTPAPAKAPARSHHLKHHRDCVVALATSHPWPTHARSLSFSIYLSLSLNFRSLSLPPSLSVWLNFWV